MLLDLHEVSMAAPTIIYSFDMTLYATMYSLHKRRIICSKYTNKIDMNRSDTINII